MKRIKGKIAIMLCVSMVMCSTLPSLASENDLIESTTELRKVEKLNEDLGEENADEILSNYREFLNDETESHDDLDCSKQHDECETESIEIEENIDEDYEEVVEESFVAWLSLIFTVPVAMFIYDDVLK